MCTGCSSLKITELEDAFSVRTLFCRDQQTLRARTLWSSMKFFGHFLFLKAELFPGRWTSCLLLGGTTPPPRALPISTSQVIWDALVPTRLVTFSEFEFPSWRFSFQYDLTKVPEARFFYLLKLGSPMLFTLSIAKVFTHWTLSPLCCALEATVQGTHFPHLWTGYNFVTSCNTVSPHFLEISVYTL